MSSSTKATAIIQLTGPDGAGKSTLCRLMLDAFADKSVLAVDTSPDANLARSYELDHPATVQSLMERLQASPFGKEAMDWALQDLPDAIAAEADAEILAWGVLPETLNETQLELLKYGLPRLFRQYDVVIWDGDLGEAQALLPSSDIRPLLVMTPADEAYCRQMAATTQGLNHPMVLLSKAEATDALPPTAAEQTRSGSWQFLGRIPALYPPEKRIRELPQYFQECFQRLDLPFEFRPAADR